MITQETVHKAFCNMPEEDKRNLAVACVRYGVTPESVERVCTNLLNAIDFTKVRKTLNYWDKDE